MTTSRLCDRMREWLGKRVVVESQTLIPRGDQLFFAPTLGVLTGVFSDGFEITDPSDNTIELFHFSGVRGVQLLPAESKTSLVVPPSGLVLPNPRGGKGNA